MSRSRHPPDNTTLPVVSTCPSPHQGEHTRAYTHLQYLNLFSEQCHVLQPYNLTLPFSVIREPFPPLKTGRKYLISDRLYLILWWGYTVLYLNVYLGRERWYSTGLWYHFLQHIVTWEPMRNWCLLVTGSSTSRKLWFDELVLFRLNGWGAPSRLTVVEEEACWTRHCGILPRVVKEVCTTEPNYAKAVTVLV